MNKIKIFLSLVIAGMLMGCGTSEQEVFPLPAEFDQLALNYYSGEGNKFAAGSAVVDNELSIIYFYAQDTELFCDADFKISKSQIKELKTILSQINYSREDNDESISKPIYSLGINEFFFTRDDSCSEDSATSLTGKCKVVLKSDICLIQTFVKDLIEKSGKAINCPTQVYKLLLDC